MRALALALGPVVLLAAACTVSDDDAGERPPPVVVEEDPVLGEDDEVVHSIAPDPSTVVEGGWCYQNATIDGTAIRMYYPANGGCSSSEYSPLVVLLRGAGYDHTDYHSLLRHLAKNGYIGVSIDLVPASLTVASYEAAADEAWAIVSDYMWTTWSKRFFIDPDNVALIGHSRGGEVVRHLAESLVGDPIFTVRGVVPLAPAYDNVIQLDGGNTVAALVLVGSADPDTTAQEAYAVHDYAGSDTSQQDPGVNANAIYRSMKLLVGGNHDGFATNDSEQAKVTQGYVLAFLHAHLKLDVTYFEDYIRGDAVPNGWPAGVTTQYSDGFYRRVVDNFDDGMIANPTLVGAVLTVDAGAGGTLNLATSNSSPHYTRVFRFTPPANNAGFQWSIPAGKRDATAFKYLSLRIGQSAGAATDDVKVRLVNGGSASAWVRVTDHGPLAQPVTMCPDGGGAFCVVVPALQAHMGTIRIPLDAFGDHDDVTSVEFKASAGAVGGEFLVDNVEFSEWILKP